MIPARYYTGMPGMSIILNEVTKSFSQKNILNKISLKIDPGQCYCLLGKNGAGKSTMIHLIADLLQPDSGQLLISEMSYADNANRIKSIMGIMPENRAVIPELTGYLYLKFVALLYSLDTIEMEQRIKSLFEYFFDGDELTKSISTYSAGMLAKISLCSALIHNPRILILDEPFAGLDALSAKLLISFLKSFLNPEHIILISSHNLLYVEQIATHIGVLDEQRLKFSSSCGDFTENGQEILEERLLNLLQSKDKNRDDLSWILENMATYLDLSL